MWERVGGTEAGGRGMPRASGTRVETWRGTQQTDLRGGKGSAQAARGQRGGRVVPALRKQRWGAGPWGPGLLSCGRIWGFLPHAEKLLGAEHRGAAALGLGFTRLSGCPWVKGGSRRQAEAGSCCIWAGHRSGLRG